MAIHDENHYIFIMKIVLQLISLLLFNSQVMATQHKAIYGEDDRLEPDQLMDSSFEKVTKSVAAVISNYSLKKIGQSIELVSLNLGDGTKYCPDVPYIGQPTAASCSSFLVAPDIVVTAGHCIKTNWDCKTKSFIFDYRMDLLGDRSGPYQRFRLKKEQIFGCKEILARKLDKRETKEDWAIIKLDRKVPGRTPLKFRKSGRVDPRSSLTLVGFPSGLPLKVATNGIVRTDDKPFYFVAEIDAFHMNSGSPVINHDTLEVEGILVRGERDFNPNSGCRSLNVCKEGTCRGEDVSKITKVPLSKYIN